MAHWCRVICTVLALAAGLSACAPAALKPADCPAGTLKLEGRPPAGAIDDPRIAKLYADRTWQSSDELEEDPIDYGRNAKVPVNHAQAKFIGSKDEDGLVSLAAKLHVIEQAEHTLDLMHYIFRDDIVGLAVLGALCDVVESGVDVRIMVDSLGSVSLDKTYLRALQSCAMDAGFMRSADGQPTIYRARVQPVIFNAASRIFVNHNRRSHDKIIVKDGFFSDKSAVMTGGRNISLAYYGVLPDGSSNPNTYRDAWLGKPEESESNPEMVESAEWISMVDQPRLRIYETGTLEDVKFGGDVTHGRQHAKYVVRNDFGFVGTTNFDYRSRLYNNEMGFFFESRALADEVRSNTEYLIQSSFRWGSPEWLEMRKRMVGQAGTRGTMTRRQRGTYKTLKSTGLLWFF